MTDWYILAIAVTLVSGIALYAWQLHKSGLKPWTAAVALPFAALLAVVLGRVLYVLLQLNYVWRRWGMGSFFRADATMFAFFGALAGLLLGVALASLLMKQPLRKSLDAFAPSFALMFALGKFAEYFLGLYGTGSYVESEALQFFPLAIQEPIYGEWYYAVFMLAGLCGLIVFVVALLRTRRPANIDGLLLLRTVFYLMMTLILSESLRCECMKWGFVKCEQLLCAITIGAAIILLCARTRLPGVRRWLPFLGVLAIVGGLVAVEFREKLHWAWPLAYSIMLVLLALLAALEVWTVRRRRLYS